MNPGPDPSAGTRDTNPGAAATNNVARLPRLLVIDDEPEIGQVLLEAARMAKYSCTVATTAKEFMGAYGPDISVVMIDLVMPETDGVELLRFLGVQQCRAAIVLMSGFDRRVMRVTEALAAEHGLRVAACLEKPFRLTEIIALLKDQAHVVDKPSVQRSARSAIVTADALQQAVLRDEFIVHYQPQVDIRSGEVVGIEALVRWQHPEQGLLYPDSFIGMAESLGMIEGLTERVINRALVDRSDYAESHPGIALSINISAKSLNDLIFPDTVSGLAETHRVPPSDLVLEITESGLIENLARSLDVLTRLRMKGMRMSIDDFGTGYSMLQQLRRVPATELKIDKSFVQDMHADDSARALVSKTIELGHDLDMTVVAEGVETEEQLSFLREHGCDVAQGYLFSRPVPLDQFMAWMEARPGT